MNYELLGNQAPHIHWHLMPRLSGDPEPHWPVWRVPHDPAPVRSADARGRTQAIRAELGLRG